jgi:hypothetical protein
MAEDSRFDWHAITRAAAFIVIITGAFGLIVPVAGALAVGPWDTLKISGSEIYRFAYWAIAWGLTIWQGQSMLNRVGHDKIIDDMLVTAAIVAVALILIKFVIWIAYQPINYDPATYNPANLDYQFAITAIDAGGALLLIVVALIGARINQA